MVVKHFTRFGLILLPSLILSLGSSAIAQSTSAADAARSGIAAHLAAIQNLSADYQLTNVDARSEPATKPTASSRSWVQPSVSFVWPSPEELTGYTSQLPAKKIGDSPIFNSDYSIPTRKSSNGGSSASQGTLILGPPTSFPNQESICTFSFLNGTALWRQESTQATIEAYRRNRMFSVSSQITAYKAERLEMLTSLVSGGRTGSLSGPDQDISTWFDVGLGLRVERPSIQWLSPTELNGMALTFDEQHRPVLTRAGIFGIDYQYTFLPEADYALCKYVVQTPSHSPGESNVAEQISAEDFRRVQGVALPFTLTWIQNSIADPSFHISRATVKVNSYSLNDPANAIDHYQVAWPAGIFIFDHRTDLSIKTESEMQDFTDAEFEQIAHRQLDR